MADYATIVPQITSGQSQKEVVANRNFDKASPAMLWGRRDEACTGLTWAFAGGHYNGNNIADGTVTATASNTNYIVADISTGAVSISTSVTNWNDSANYLRLYQITAGVSAINNDWLDRRDPWTSSVAASVANNAITNAKLADMATQTIKGRTTAGTGDPEDLTATQATAILNSMVGDSGSGGTKGLAPAPGAGDTAAGKFLKADGTWAVPVASSVADSDYGDITISSGVWTIDNNVVTNAKLADMATASFKGRTTAGTGDPEDLTATQATAILNAMVGDSGSGGTKGLVPAPGAGDAAALKYLKADGTWATASITREIQFSCSDITTALTAGTSKAVFRAPRGMTITAVRASLATAQASGSIFTVDINEEGTSILSTKLTIDNTEKTSTTAATAAVISDSTITDDNQISVDIDQVGDGTAKGLVVTIYYT